MVDVAARGEEAKEAMTEVEPDWLKQWRKTNADSAVSCVASGRWLELSRDGSSSFDGEVITISVMTDASGQPHKLCELIVPREELLRVLSLIERPSR